eukprot:3351796-Rhodomonas_salina.1
MCHQWRGRKVLGWCDNTATIAAINKGRSRSGVLTGIARRIRLICIEFDIHLWLCHIAGKDNIVPDALSRYALEPRTESWSLIQETWEALVRRYGKFDVDAFADVNGVNSRAPAHHSSVNPPFGRSFEDQKVWAFQPPSLAARFLDEARAWNASSVLALVPEAAFRETAEGWMRLRTFTFEARVFTRWHWGKRLPLEEGEASEGSRQRRGRRRRAAKRGSSARKGQRTPAEERGFEYLERSRFTPGTKSRLSCYERASPCCDGTGRACLENRAMGMECEDGACDNKDLQMRKFLGTEVRQCPEELKGSGLFALEPGQIGDMVEEMVGLVITAEVAEQ